MSPQPLSFYRDARLRSGLLETEKTDPEACALAMHYVAMWSHVEREKVRLVTTLLRSEFQVVNRMLLALESSSARRAVLIALAKERMPGDMDLLRRALKAADTAEKHRNKFAHWIFAIAVQGDGATPKLPERRLVLVPPDSLTSTDAETRLRENEFDALNQAYSGATTEEDRSNALKALSAFARQYVRLLPRSGYDHIPLHPEIAKKITHAHRLVVEPDLSRVSVYTLEELQKLLSVVRMAYWNLNQLHYVADIWVRYGVCQEDDPIRSELSKRLPERASSARGDPQSGRGSLPASDLRELEELRSALARADGSIRAAAEILGVSPSTVRRRKKKYGL